MISSKILYDYFEGKCELHTSIVNDLFGYMNWTIIMKQNKTDTLTMFLGLYKGLYIIDVSYKEIYRCFLKNKLDELIHVKYSINKNVYYAEFYEKNIIIGETFIVEDCENNEDYNIPFIYSTIQPPFHFNQSKTQIAEISLKNENTIILYKINSYKQQDIKKGRIITSNYVSINDVKKLLFKQDNKCYVCSDNVITEEWEQNCLYQFTLDRIDNSLPHDKNNVLICCYYCNCYGWLNDATDMCQYKLCHNKCHAIKRNITRKKDNISKEEINKLLLK